MPAWKGAKFGRGATKCIFIEAPPWDAYGESSSRNQRRLINTFYTIVDPMSDSNNVCVVVYLDTECPWTSFLRPLESKVDRKGSAFTRLITLKSKHDPI